MEEMYGIPKKDAPDSKQGECFTMKKELAIFMAAVGTAWTVAGCGTQKAGEGGGTGQEKPGIVLTVSMPASEWGGYVEGLSELYIKDHPEIRSIEWNLVDRCMYPDLLSVSLASRKLPDIICVGFEGAMEEWKDHLLALDGLEALSLIPEPYRMMGSLEGTVYSVPIQIQGIGIAYNRKLLSAAGWDHFPETKSEFGRLCEALEGQGIKPIMNHYKETLLTMANNLFMLPAMAQEDPASYMGVLLKEGREEEYRENWQALADYFDLTLRFGNRDSLTTGTPMARNYFFIEKYAMLNDEGSWLAPVLAKEMPALEQEISIGGIPLYEEADKNKLVVEVQALSVVNSSRYSREAAEFLNWLASSKEASQYLKEAMGCLPVTDMDNNSLEGLSPLAAQVKESILEGHTAFDVVNCLPDKLRNKSAELWGFYLTGDLSREEALKDYQSLWKEYIEQQ